MYQKEVKSPKSLDEGVENEPQIEEIKGVEDDLTLSIGVNNDELTNKLIVIMIIIIYDPFTQ